MAGNFHPAEVPYDPAGVDAAPSTQAPNDYFSVHANPDDFGAQVGQAFQHLGAGVRSAAEDFGQIQQLHNEASVNAALTSYMQGNQQLLYSPPQTDAKGNPVPNTGGYFSQNGANAVNGYQNTLNAADQNYQSARANLNPRQQVMFDQLARRMHQSTLMEIGQHSTRQGEAWQDQQTQSFISTTSDAAVQAAMSGKADDFDHYIDQGMSAAIHWSDLKGLGSDYGQEQAAKFVGGTVANAAKQFIALGQPNDAQALLDKYGAKMDKGSALAVEAALKTHTRDVQAQAFATWYRNGMQGPPPPVGDHGGAQGAAGAQGGTAQPAPQAVVPHTDRPMPKEYADQGMSQAEWDKMNAPDADQTSATTAPAQTGGQPAGNAPAAPASKVAAQTEGAHGDVIGIINNAAAKYGIDPALMTTMARIESGFNPSAHNPSGAAGLFQFMPGTARQFGLANPLDPVASADAAARLVVANRDYLTKVLGRTPTNGELYLAHQQGAGGAAKLLSNPDARAVDIVGKAAVTGNGGRADMTAGEFASMWTSKFGQGGGNQYSVAGPGLPQGISPEGRQLLLDQHALSDNGHFMPIVGSGDQSAQPTDVGASHQQKADILQDKASVIADVQRRFANDPEMATAITSKFNQQLAASSLSQQADAQQAIAAQDAGYNKYYTSLLKGAKGDDLVQQIANDNSLTGTTKEHLVNAIQTYGQGKALGSDFYSYFQRVHSNGADKISSPDQIYGMVDGQHLTIEGADKLRTEMAGKNTIDATATTEMMKGTLAYIKHQISFEADYGLGGKIPDPVGEDIFNSRAIPAFYKAYEDGLKAGKSPYDLLTAGSKDYVADRIVQTFKRNPTQEMKDKIAAGADVVNNAPAASGASTVPPPQQFDLNSAEGVAAAYRAGSISRVDANQRLDLMRKNTTPAGSPPAPQVPNGP